MKIWILCHGDTSDDPEPSWPQVFTTEAAADAAFEKEMREEWDRAPPENDVGVALDFPADAVEAHEMMVEYHGSSWGQWEITPHEIDHLPMIKEALEAAHGLWWEKGAPNTEVLKRLIASIEKLEALPWRSVDAPPNPWRSLAADPPGPEHGQGFLVGSSTGGRMDFVFTWPHPKTGKPAFWRRGVGHMNCLMEDYKPDVWHPGPPPISGNAVARFQKSGDVADLS